jgi:elongation factor Ts
MTLFHRRFFAALAPKAAMRAFTVPMSVAAASATEKSALASLRKKTGYSFINCKKALAMFNDDVAQAEQWLHEQAQKEGWTKATKLESRVATQGLVGIVARRKVAAMVEVNCETDFVARNEVFQSLVRDVAKSCLDSFENRVGFVGMPSKVPKKLLS